MTDSHFAADLEVLAWGSLYFESGEDANEDVARACRDELAELIGEQFPASGESLVH